MAAVTPRAASARGFTLIELLISFVLLGLALAISAQLLIGAQQRMAHEALRSGDPITDLALRQLSRDAQTASSVPSGVLGIGVWSVGELELHGHPLGTVTYRQVGTELIRKVHAAGPGGTSHQRVVLQRLSTWRWRLTPATPRPLVEIELSHRRTGPAPIGSRRQAGEIVQTHRLKVSARGGGGTWW